MDNIVLKSLSAENFASFAERVTFTTEADASKKENLGNTFTEGDLRFNKVSFIYGANGSGKTYFCKILREIQRYLTLSPLLDSFTKSFAFDVSYQEKPTTFCIEVVIDKTVYHYEFSVLGKQVERELLTKKYRRREVLIDRKSPSYKDITLRSELKGFEATKQTVKPETLCLPIAAMLNNELASKLNNAICGIRTVNMAKSKLNPLAPEEAFSKERLSKYIRVIQKADPTIRDISISLSEKEIPQRKLATDDFEDRETIIKATMVGVDSKHAVYDNGVERDSQSPISFFADESLGTIKLFTALPYLYDVLESGGTLIIDEVENGLHLSLAKEIISLFTNEESNPHNAQLICTSHQPLLLDGDYRRDQVWIAAKDSFGKSSLHRLSEKQTPRAKVNLTAQLLKGAFGCNPDMFFDNNT